MSNVVYGAVVGSVSGLLNSVSLTLQKAAHQRIANAVHQKANNSYISQPLWLLGIFLMIVAELLNFYAFSMAPVYVIAPLGALAVVFNAIWAKLWLGEDISLYQYLGIGLCLGGAITILVNASGGLVSPPQAAIAILKNVFSVPFYVYIVYVIVAGIGLSRRISMDGNRPPVLLYVMLTATIGSLTVVSAKSSVLFWRDIESLPSSLYFIPYLLSVVPMCSVLLQVRYLNVALSNFGSTQVVPMQYVLFTILSTLGSAVVFREFGSVSGSQIFGIIMGFGYSGGGVFLLTRPVDRMPTVRKRKLSMKARESPAPVEPLSTRRMDDGGTPHARRAL